jgi:hypothetical protein
VIELMPPAVKTSLAVDLEGGVTLMPVDELVKQSFASLKAGALEIRPGQAKQLASMRRLAPNFITGNSGKALRPWCPLGHSRMARYEDGAAPRPALIGIAGRGVRNQIAGDCERIGWNTQIKWRRISPLPIQYPPPLIRRMAQDGAAEHRLRTRIPEGDVAETPQFSQIRSTNPMRSWETAKH